MAVLVEGALVVEGVMVGVTAEVEEVAMGLAIENQERK